MASSVTAGRVGPGVVALMALTTLVPALGMGAGPLAGQELPGQVRIDSIDVRGAVRTTRDAVLVTLGFQAGDLVTRQQLQEAAKAIWAIGQYRDLTVRALGGPGEPVLLVLELVERPLIRRTVIQGLEHGDPGQVRDSAGLGAGAPFAEHQVIMATAMIRRQLASEGIPFARIQDRVEPVEGLDNVVDVILEVDEGNRVAVSQVVVRGNEAISGEDIVSAMTTRPEGFWWFKSGSYDDDGYEVDILQNIPRLYSSRGYLDFQILADSLVVDPNTGKARVEIEVSEGPQYRIQRFSIDGNDVVGDEELEPYFRPDRGGLLQSLGLRGGEEVQEREQLGQVFDQPAFDAAVDEIRQLYSNRGYIFADVGSTIEKSPPISEGEPHTVSVSVRVEEGSPAFINRIIIEGNDYTHEWVIRDKILLLPGQTYSMQDILQSYQSIQSLGFFEQPLPAPDILPNPETGEVDITFHVVERPTGAVNFGTSVGGGVGLSGFIGYDQPNLFGQAKGGHFRWDFGRFLNSLTLTFSDPALFRSRISGTMSLFNSRDRFFQFQSGRRQRLGTDVRFGFPIPGWFRTRFFAGYGISKTKYTLRQGEADTSLFGQAPGTQSQVSLGLTRSTLNHPIFPTAGSRQSVNLELNGGILGGSGDFQKLTAEGRWRVPVGDVGGTDNGVPTILFSMGVAVRSGAIFGDATRFPFDQFWMGGVNFGEQLRGYDETSITPFGYFPERSGSITDINRLGQSFLALTADYSIILNNNLQLSTFFDAGNVWGDPQEIAPARLFRSAGVGLQLVTPFGPIGIDYAYGFDKTVPGWQFHFKMGPGF
ncbi:MAG TPA: outer membrane protein assembly factor BamA [Longimicrobiales bacterium]